MFFRRKQPTIAPARMCRVHCQLLWVSTLDISIRKQDFSWDIAVSNPPFSRKLDVFKRLDSLGKPWAMVMNTMALNYMEVGDYFADGQIQIMIPNKRVSFNGKPSSFNSSFVCRSFLPRDLMFCRVANCNSGKDYVPSRMYKEGGHVEENRLVPEEDRLGADVSGLGTGIAGKNKVRTTRGKK